MGYGVNPSALYRDPFVASKSRYETLRPRTPNSIATKLPPLSLGMWQNFSSIEVFETSRRLVLHAFDRGIYSFDLANNYGRPPGSAEEFFGRLIRSDLGPYRHELFVSTKAGYDMWPGPCGKGSCRKYLVASIDESLKRLNVDYVDVFYTHRFDESVSLEETARALDFIVRSGRAMYVALSSYPLSQALELVRLMKDLKTPISYAQYSYSILTRWAEEPFAALAAEGVCCLAFSVYAQGLLSDKYLRPNPLGRMNVSQGSLHESDLSPSLIVALQALLELASAANVSLSKLALAWVLRNANVTSAIIGVRTFEQLNEAIDIIEECTVLNGETQKAIDIFNSGAYVDPWSYP
jgi:L-glyceraldehyde 3-phosphate reductase